MDLARLAEFEGLFGHRFHTLALISLFEEGPMRWSGVGRAMNRRAEERVEDKYVTRSLQALRKDSLVDILVDGDGFQVHTLTPRGQQRAKRIAQIFAALDQESAPDRFLATCQRCSDDRRHNETARST
jgi:DNA-binding PadR family transcriptional regulator